ncbi:ABC transporter permease [Deinococcus maricopensis]|uniref:ABC-type transporter, integral membrane subunit n=1 Tax=Deinococcus maricopensis (strain DSM 21211 / LMG 22137 / NRRL B-23946 / LB-34) TaxID=709986 RepID=E8U9E7_DEIML|nr:ABC transporter permease [Deinococcus maricopensis]ADV67686.1 ABC-type transporter, integral membrane subunit [Deinococcus maricopensis DSM 21211]
MSTTTAPAAPAQPVKSQSLYQIAWIQFKKHPLARAGMAILIVLYIIALLAGFLSPYSLTEYESGSNRISWSPPTTVHWRDDKGRFGPFVYGLKREVDLETFRDKYTEDRSTKYPVKFFVRRESAPYKILGIIPSTVHLFGVEEPAAIHLWGTDNLGRDQFSRILFGAQFSLTIGIIASLMSIVIGMIMGGLAGYFGGWVDSLIMRVVEVLTAVPELFLLITLRALFPLDIDPLLVMYLIIGILALVGWGGIARVVRSQLLSTREQDYVQAAVSLGASDSRIIGRHMLPNTLSYIIVSLSLSIPGYILTESGLSFLGIGIVEPYASWGSLLKLAQDGGFESISGRPWVLIPGVFIFLAVIAWQFVGDGLRDAFDPRRRR